MKKTMTRNIVIMAIVTVIMAVVLSLYIKSTGTVPAADSTASLADGTYTASEQGCPSRWKYRCRRSGPLRLQSRCQPVPGSCPWR